MFPPLFRFRVPHGPHAPLEIHPDQRPWPLMWTAKRKMSQMNLTRVSHSSFTKYCICHAKWLSWLILITYFTERLFYIILRSFYFTELFRYWSVTLLDCYLTELLLSCYFTERLLYWTATLLMFTELLLFLSCHSTELLLDWTVTLLNCHFTALLLYWAAILLNCFFTEFFTLLSCYSTVTFYWAVTLLNSLPFWISITRKFLT